MGSGELLDSDALSATREDIFNQDIVDLRLVLAGVGEDNDAIIEIEALADGGKDDTTGSNSSEDDSINVVGSQDAAKASVGKHAIASFRQNRVALVDIKLGVKLCRVGSKDNQVGGLKLGELLGQSGAKEGQKEIGGEK